MQKGKPAGTPPLVEDLDERQRRIYEMLPEEGRRLFLEMLPPIEPTPESERQAALIRGRVRALEVLERYAREERARLAKLLPSVDRGKKVDIRRELAPPAIAGVTVKFSAQPQPAGTAAPPPAPAPEPKPSEEPPAPARPAASGRPRRDAAAAPAAAPRAAKAAPEPPSAPAADEAEAAPFGRDPKGVPYMPWGARSNGAPARPGGKYATQQIEAFLALVREKPHLTDAQATAEYQRRKSGAGRAA
jgi:hypothetical protein